MNDTLVSIAAFLEAGGSRVCNLHESAGSWAAEELMRIVDGRTNLCKIMFDEMDAIAAGEGYSQSYAK